MKHRTIKAGDVVRLKGRKRTATVEILYDDIPGGLRLNKPLGGFVSWNEADLEFAPKFERSPEWPYAKPKSKSK